MINGEMQDYPLTLDRFLSHGAKWYPNAKIVTTLSEDHTIRSSFAEFHRRCRGLSHGISELGVAQGEHVATLAWNTQSHLEAWYSIMNIGAVCLTLNPRVSVEQLVVMVRQANARVLMVSADQQALVHAMLAHQLDLETVVVTDGAIDASCFADWPTLNVIEQSSLFGDVSDSPLWGNFPETAPAGLCFTSGTTGAPKGVTYTHRSSYLHAQRLMHASTMAVAERETILVATPLFHANAWGLPFAALGAGASLILPGRDLHSEQLARTIAQEAVTVCVGVPTVWLGLVDYVEKQHIELPSLERIIMGGAPLPSAVLKRIESALGVRVQTSWGMTELSPLGSITAPYSNASHQGASGKPPLGVDLAVTDVDGKPLMQQREEEGHLVVRGSSVIQRYFGHKDPADHARGWFITGDLAKIDEGGQLYITGRAKDLIKSGGEWINPAEIERIVGAFPEVSLAAVIGRVDAKWGERPILLLEMRRQQSLSDDAILEALAAQVPKWWIPDGIYRLDTMPLATTGKIDKNKLRAEYSVPMD